MRRCNCADPLSRKWIKLVFSDNRGVDQNSVFRERGLRIGPWTRRTCLFLALPIGLDEADVCWAVVDPIWPTAETEDELALLDQGTKGQQAIYVTIVYAQEVDNGYGRTRNDKPPFGKLVIWAKKAFRGL